MIEKIRIRNFKSLVDTGELEFNNNIVVLAGRNNAGKTAVLEALNRCFKGIYKPYNISSSGSSSEGINQPSPAFFDLWFKLSEEEQSAIFPESLSREWWRERVLISLEANSGTTSVKQLSLLMPQSNEADSAYWYDQSTNSYTGRRMTAAGNYVGLENNEVVNFMSHVFSKLANLIIFINGNRVIQPVHSTDIQTRLNTVASNLHAVLYTLHNNQEEIFDEIQRKFTDIFPDVKRLQTRVVQNNGLTNCHVEFKDGLAVPLQECGTGLTHVLVMLCVVYLERNRIVLFDEPHSFLHPSAEKSIYDLAVKENHHQFVFTTHSPILLNYPSKKTLYLVQKTDGGSVFEKLDTVEDALLDIGVINSDLTLSDFVLFVEGETEGLLFRPILTAFDLVPFGKICNIIPLGGSGRIAMNSGEMRRNAELMNKVLSAVSRIRISYHIVIDRDERDESTIDRIMKQYGEHISVLPKREIENYLLVPEAITEILSHYGLSVDVTQVEKKLADLLERVDDHELYPRGCHSGHEVDVKGSAVLDRIFSKYGMPYQKKRHGKMLTDWILENNKQFLNELLETLKPIFL